MRLLWTLVLISAACGGADPAPASPSTRSVTPVTEPVPTGPRVEADEDIVSSRPSGNAPDGMIVPQSVHAPRLFDQPVIALRKPEFATQMILDRRGRTWLVTHDAIYRRGAKAEERLALSALTRSQPASVSLVERPDGEVSIATLDGLWTWSARGEKRVATWPEFPAYGVIARFAFVGDELWRSLGRETWRFRKGVWKQHSMRVENIVSQGGATYATSQNRLLRWDGSDWVALYTAEPLDRFLSLSLRGDALYAGMDNGVAVISTEGQLVARHLLGKAIMMVQPLDAGVLWAVVGQHGLMRFDGKRWTYDPTPPNASIVADDHGNVLLMNEGVWRAADKELAARMTQTIEERYAGARYFVSHQAACASLLGKSSASGDIHCVTRGKHTYSFIGTYMVAADGHANVNIGIMHSWPSQLAGARNAGGTVVVVDRTEGSPTLHVLRKGSWSSSSLEAEKLPPASPDGSVMVDGDDTIWLKSAQANHILRIQGDRRSYVPPPLPDQPICSVFNRAGKLVVQQGDGSNAHCKAFFERTNDGWTRLQAFAPHQLDIFPRARVGKKWVWGCCTDFDGKFADLALMHEATHANVLGLTSLDRIPVTVVAMFANDAQGNLWLMDSGGGVAVLSQRYLLTGKAD